MDHRRKNLRDPERWIELVTEAHSQQPFAALSITSVAAPDHEGLMRDYETIIEGVLERLPDLAVGVEPYVRGSEDISRLKRAGAHEIKINIQSPVQDILDRICPGWSLERQYELLEEAVRVFGPGKVTTNIIIGLGETDGDVEGALERLAAMGVVPSVRAVRLNDLNRPHLDGALGHQVLPVTPERHLALARILQRVLAAYGLSVESFDTMCHKCGCCDLEPGRDI
jgi:biotin synthase-related radical SAM superfamily protein